MIDYKLFNKDCRSMIELPDNSVHVVCTSPPYWGLRKYSGEQDLIWGDNHCEHEWGGMITVNRGTLGNNLDTLVGSQTAGMAKAANQLGQYCSLCGAWRGAFGLEPTPELYTQHSVEILREVRRVLRPDGVVFWNIGDSYAGGSIGGFRPGAGRADGIVDERGQRNRNGNNCPPGLKPLDLCLIPEKLAIALQEDGWWVRSIIVWHKPNPMPESVNGWRWEQHRVLMWPDGRLYKPVKGVSRPEEVELQDCPGCPKCTPNDGLVLRKGSWRPTDSYEQILMLTKTANYYCDADVVRENKSPATVSDPRTNDNGHRRERGFPGSNDSGGTNLGGPEGGRNLRNVWSFPTVPYPGAHFAVFPEKLPETCIKAATPEKGVCAECGSPWARIIDTSYRIHEKWFGGKQGGRHSRGSQGTSYKEPISKETIGWRPTCSCNCPETAPATILDPFAGAGTTLLAAIKLGRSAIGYEISSQYCDMINKRIDKVQIRYS